MNPKVSIIIPCYGVEKYLDRCLESVVNQTLQEIEIILVDDKSPDKVPIMCEEWAKKDPRISVVHKEKNEGLGFARNTGMKKVSGEYVAFLDSDDFIDKQMYQKLYETAKRYADLQAVFCSVNRVDALGNIYAVNQEYDSFTEITSNEECRRIGMEIVSPMAKTSLLKYTQSVWHGIYNFDFIKRNHLHFCSEREFISEDIIFDIDFMSVANHIAYVPEAYNYYCDNSTSLSKTFRKDRFEKTIKMWQEICRRYKALGYPLVAQVCANKYVIGQGRNFIYSCFRNNFSFLERWRMIKEVISCGEVWSIAIDSKTKKILPISILFFYYIIKLKSTMLAFGYGYLKMLVDNIKSNHR